VKAVSAPTKVELAELGPARVEAPGAGQATLRRLLRLRWGLAALGVLLLVVAAAALAHGSRPTTPWP
jgi:hypothetical protein